MPKLLAVVAILAQLAFLPKTASSEECWWQFTPAVRIRSTVLARYDLSNQARAQKIGFKVKDSTNSSYPCFVVVQGSYKTAPSVLEYNFEEAQGLDFSTVSFVSAGIDLATMRKNERYITFYQDPNMARVPDNTLPNLNNKIIWAHYWAIYSGTVVLQMQKETPLTPLPLVNTVPLRVTVPYSFYVPIMKEKWKANAVMVNAAVGELSTEEAPSEWPVDFPPEQEVIATIVPEYDDPDNLLYTHYDEFYFEDPLMEDNDTEPSPESEGNPESGNPEEPPSEEPPSEEPPSEEPPSEEPPSEEPPSEA